MSSIAMSLWVASMATAANLVAGVLLAWLLAYGRFRGRQLLDVVVNLPIVLPPTVVGYGLLLLVGRSGPVGGLMRALGWGTLIFTPYAAMMASAIVSLPLLVQAARIALEDVPVEVVEAAQVDGAGRLAILRHMLLPLAWPGVAVGVLLAFARAMGEFGATLMVAGNIPGRTQTMPVAIYAAVQAGHMNEAGQLSAMLVALVGVVMWAGMRWGRRVPGWSPARRTAGAPARGAVAEPVRTPS
ncbi:MAG: molybdate ABC transporter permease subunit [Limnochordaceae bacterium]|nr:molybdate ABC transporter permease subunit [Limnochordaceae bacterium]